MNRFPARGLGLAGLGAIIGVLGLSSSAFGAVAGGGNTPAASVLYPQVQTATVTQRGGNSGGGQPQVTVCFNTNVVAPMGGFQAASFTLRGFNVADTLNPVTAPVVASGNGMQNCLVLSFRASIGGSASANVQGFTKVDIAQGAVASPNSGAPTNPPEAAQLDGSDIANAVKAGGNSGPVLTGATVNNQGNNGQGTIVYSFDKAIDCTGTNGTGSQGPNATDFGFYSSTSTTPFRGTAVVSCNSTGSSTQTGTVEISFTPAAPATGQPAAQNPPVSSAVREFALFGAVITLDHNSGASMNPTQQKPDAPGGATINPFIVSASQSSPGSAQFTITYNESVNAGPGLGSGSTNQGMPTTAGNICAQLSDGSQRCASGAASVNGATVTVSFPDTTQFTEKIVSVSDNGGAVRDQNTMPAGGNPSAVSSVATQTLALLSPGFVDSDNLRQCVVNSNNTVTYTFVGPIISDATALNAAAFNLVNTNGGTLPAGSAVLQGDRRSVVAQFQSAQTAAAVACEVNGVGSPPVAATDGEGKGNDQNTVGLGAATSTPPGGTLSGGGMGQTTGGPGSTPSGPGPGPGPGTTTTTTTGGTTTGSTPPGITRKRARLTEKASKRGRGKFIRFHVTGKLIRPAGVSQDAGCKGNINVTIKHGNKTVSHRVIGVRANCTYSTFVTVSKKRLRGRKANKVIVRFEGNNRLLPGSQHRNRV